MVSLFERSIKCIIALSVEKRLREATQRGESILVFVKNVIKSILLSIFAKNVIRRDTRGKKKKKGELMKESRSERIIKRQKQCGTCQSERPGFCALRKKRFADMNIWENCKDFKRKDTI